MGKWFILLFVMLSIVPARAQSDEDNGTDEDESGFELAGNVSLVSDYVLRGFSMTDHQPAIQGGFDHAPDDGVYVGVWGSNVHFLDSDSSLELDSYAGYTKQFSDSFSVSLGAEYITFFVQEDRNSWGFPLRFRWKAWSLELIYSPDWNDQGAGIYYFAEWRDQLHWWKLTGTVDLGYSEMFDPSYADDQPDLRLTIERPFFGVDWGVAGVITKEREVNGEVADSRLIFSMTQYF